MKIYPVTDPAFAPYGKILEGYDLAELLQVLKEKTPVPEGTGYVASQPELEALPIAEELSLRAYGGMPIQLGWCNGHNTTLNCLEYHRDSELNCGVQDFILLLAKEDEIENGHLDTGKVKAFRVPIALPRGTNGPKPEITPKNGEDQLLWACNKWLLAHAESPEAAQGAPVRLDGVNIDLTQDLQ